MSDQVLGFPTDNTANDTGAVTQSLPDTNAEPGFFGKIGAELKQDFSWGQLASDVDVIKSGVVSGYDTAKSAVTTVVTDIGTPVENALSSIYTRVIIIVVVLGGVIYFAGKSGALRVSKIV